MRRVLVICLGLLVAMVVGSTDAALADPGVIKGVFIEDFQGTMPLDDPTFTDASAMKDSSSRTATASTTSPSTLGARWRVPSTWRARSPPPS